MSTKKFDFIIGFLAGTCSTSAFIPQVYEVYKTKKINIPLTTLIIFFIGQILWMIHGIKKSDLSVFLFAFITGLLYFYLLYAKFTFN